MTNGTALLKVPLRVVEAVVPWRTLPVPIEIQKYLNEKTLSKAYWNQCAYGPNQLGLIQSVYRKQPTTLHKSAVNNSQTINWVAEQIPIKNGAAVLDINTGTGVVARSVASRGAGTVVGTDISRHMISFASTQSGKVNYVRAKSQSLPLEDNSFDIVVSRLAFNHIVERDAVLGEMARVCKPGGFIALIERIFPEDIHTEDFENRMNFLEYVRDPSHIWFINVAEMKELLKRNGVEVNVTSTTEVQESLSSYLDQFNTVPPNREHIRQWVSGNVMSADPDHNQITGFKPFKKDDGFYLTHTHAFVGGFLSKE